MNQSHGIAKIVSTNTKRGVALHYNGCKCSFKRKNKDNIEKHIVGEYVWECKKCFLEVRTFTIDENDNVLVTNVRASDKRMPCGEITIQSTQTSLVTNATQATTDATQGSEVPQSIHSPSIVDNPQARELRNAVGCINLLDFNRSLVLDATQLDTEMEETAIPACSSKKQPVEQMVSVDNEYSPPAASDKDKVPSILEKSFDAPVFAVSPSNSRIFAPSNDYDAAKTLIKHTRNLLIGYRGFLYYFIMKRKEFVGDAKSVKEFEMCFSNMDEAELKYFDAEMKKMVELKLEGEYGWEENIDMINENGKSKLNFKAYRDLINDWIPKVSLMNGLIKVIMSFDLSSLKKITLKYEVKPIPITHSTKSSNEAKVYFQKNKELEDINFQDDLSPNSRMFQSVHSEIQSQSRNLALFSPGRFKTIRLTIPNESDIEREEGMKEHFDGFCKVTVKQRHRRVHRASIHFSAGMSGPKLTHS